MPNALRIAAAQPHTVVGDLNANVAAHAAAVAEARGGLVVFPELSLTGYDVAEPTLDPADPALRPLIEACAAHGSVALAGAPVAAGADRAIGVLRVDGTGAQVIYRKMSLGGAELTHFVAGTTPTATIVDGWRVGVGICKDSRIAEHLQATAALGIDLYVAGMVHAPEELHEFAERAARIAAEFGVPVAFAGCAGRFDGPYPDTSGGSGIWGPDGETLAQAGAAVDEVVTATLEVQPACKPGSNGSMQTVRPGAGSG